MNVFPEGDGVFETIKTVDGVPQFLARHLERAIKSSRTLGLPIFSPEEVVELIRAEIERTGIFPFGRLRVTFPTDGRVFAIHEPSTPWSVPAKLMIFHDPIDEDSALAGHKALPYKENLDLLAQARSAGFDDGIRLNSASLICESAVANVVMKVDGKWITPTLSSGCLPGITRAIAIEWFGINEKDLPRSALSAVQSMFLLSSLKNLQPVEFLDGRKLDMSDELLQVARAQTVQDLVD